MTVMLQECVSMWGFSQSRSLLVDAALHWWPSVAPVLLLQLASLLWWQWLHSNKWDVCLFSVGLEKVWKILNFLLLEQVCLFLDKLFTLKMSSYCCCWDNSKVVSLKTRIISNLRPTSLTEKNCHSIFNQSLTTKKVFKLNFTKIKISIIESLNSCFFPFHLDKSYLIQLNFPYWFAWLLIV